MAARRALRVVTLLPRSASRWSRKPPTNVASMSVTSSAEGVGRARAVCGGGRDGGSGEGSFIDRGVGGQVVLRCLGALVGQPEGEYRRVLAGLQQTHGCGVA